MKSEKGCLACKENDPCCLDFHHLEDKNFSIGYAIAERFKWEKIENEIKKCVVLCSNCHRKLHAKRFCLSFLCYHGEASGF